MSSTDGDDSGPGRREVAHRLFAAEFDDATVSYAKSDEERAPKYVVTPTGARLNRLFAVGVLTEVESVNEDVLRTRVVDPTGAFVSYAGQYQPDAAAFFERADPPAFVALTGKARTFEPEDGDRIYSSVRPESVSEVDAETRDRWTVSAAEATLRRIATMAEARTLDAEGEALTAALEDRGYDPSLAAGVRIARDRYGTTTAYLDALREVALDTLEVVTGEREAVRSLDRTPDDTGTSSLGPLPMAVGDDGDDGAETGSGSTPTADTETTTTDAGSDTPEATPANPDDDAGSVAGSGTPANPDDEGPAVEASPADGSESATGLGEFDEPDDLSGLDEPDDDDDDDGSGDDLYELDEEERREVEESFDVGFESGAEVDEPGEAGIDVPGPEDLDAEPDELKSGAEADTDAVDPVPGSETGDDESGDTAGSSGAASDATTDVDLESAAVAAMDELDDGDGAARDAVVAAVVDEYGADPGAVADAIEDALMSGKCYEPGEDSLKAI
jgi:RPA family protein